MGSIDDSDDQKLKIMFTAEGVIVLREKLNEKLKEFMGDYSDEILVDYVIVLLRNGKGKGQAKNELNVFLGDDTDSFVSWLWDHLSFNMDLYVQSKGLQDEVAKSNLPSKVQTGNDGFQNSNSKSERVRSRTRRNKDWKALREAETTPIQSFVVDDIMHLDKKPQSKLNSGPRQPSHARPVQRKRSCAVLHLDEKPQSNVNRGPRPPSPARPVQRKRSCAVLHLDKNPQSKVNRGPRPPSPARPVQRKRSCAVEQQKTKRDSVSQVTIDAPRRLLQFAVRDAVATSWPSNLVSSLEPSFNRLSSVISSSSVESSAVEHPHMMHTLFRVANPMASVFKAVEEAAEDVVKFKSSRSEFDQMGCDMYPSYGNTQFEDNQYEEQSPLLYHENNDYVDQYAANMTMLDHETGSDMYPSFGNMQFEDNQYEEQSPLLYHKNNDYVDQYAANMTMLDHETGFSSDSSSDNEGFHDVNFMGNRVGRQLDSSGGKRSEDSLMVHHNVSKSDDDIMLLKKNRNQEQSSAAPDTSKIVNISVNVNAWNPPVPAQYQKPIKVVELSGHKTLNPGIGAPRSGPSMVTENAKMVIIDNGKAKHNLDLLKETQKAPSSTPVTGSSAPSCSLDDADSRTIFASNVHFAATKDAICQHFNKFGEVLKAVIVTDSMTGQPKGAAYVEFMHKEAADNALLSLNGTSFMSRILKVVKKSAAQHQDYAPAMPLPRGVKGSPYPPDRFLRAPIPTSFGRAFSPKSPIKFGARSLQWRRDAQGTSSTNGATLNNNSICTPPSRGFTYVREQKLKLDGSSSTT